MRYPILLRLILLLRKALTSFIGTCEWKTICKLSSRLMVHVLGMLYKPHNMMMKKKMIMVVTEQGPLGTLV